MIERVKTEIPGFDKVIEGGLVKNSLNLLAGGTGTGKTIFCLQFLLNGAKKFNEKGIYISFEEQEEDLKTDAAVLGLSFEEVYSKVKGFDLNSDQKLSKIKFVHIDPTKIIDFLSLLKKELALFDPKRVVIDPMSALSMAMEDNFERRKQIFKIKDTLKSMNCTSILTSEVPTEGMTSLDSIGRFSRFEVEEFLCDSVIVLHYAGIGGSADRAIQVIKMRRTNHLRGPIPMEIKKGGIKVLRGK